MVFVFNRRLGERQKSRIQDHLKQMNPRFPYSWQIRETDYAGHARLLAKQAAEEGAYGVVAVGGDGTVNEVIDGLRGTKSMLGILPFGSGNGLARSLGIKRRLPEALSVIAQGQFRPIDLGFANSHLFASNAGLGFETEVIEGFHRFAARGIWSYARVILSRFWTYRPAEFLLTFSDGTQLRRRPFLLTVANGQAWGYGFWLDKKGSISDGKLDLTMVHPFPWWAGVCLIWHSLMGSLGRSRYTEIMQVRELTISQEGLRQFQVDGDLAAAHDTIKFSILPAGIMVFVPAKHSPGP